MSDDEVPKISDCLRAGLREEYSHACTETDEGQMSMSGIGWPKGGLFLDSDDTDDPGVDLTLDSHIL